MVVKKYGDTSLDEVYDVPNESNNFYKKIHKDSLELLKSNDVLSANTLNRSVLKLYEDVKNNYKAFQWFSKLVLQDKQTCYIKDTLEDFNKKNLSIVSFGEIFNNNIKRYLRIPTGALIINNKGVSNDGTDDFSSRIVNIDDNVSVYINSPKTSLFEREIASHFGIDLNEGDNAVNVDYKVVKNNSSNKLSYNYKIDILKRTTEAVVDNSGQQYTVPTIKVQTYNNNVNNTLNNVCSLVDSISGNLTSNYRKKDGYYSLEELIPLPPSIPAGKNYAYVFFNTNIDADSNNYFGYDTDVYYSHSGKFGIFFSNLDDNEQNPNQTLKNCGLALYKITITNNSTYIYDSEHPDNNDNYFLNGNSVEEYLQPLDRNLLELRKLKVNFKTDLKGQLNVQGQTDLIGDTTVNGITTINNNFNVKKGLNTYNWQIIDDDGLNNIV